MPILQSSLRDLTAARWLNPVCNWIVNGPTTAADDSGNNNNATVSSTTRAASWDGVNVPMLTNNLVSVNDIAAYQGEVSLEWIEYFSGSSASTFTCGVGATDTYWSASFSSANMTWVQTEAGVRATQTFTSGTVFDRGYYHLGAVRLADKKTLAMYVNGLLMGTVVRATACNAAGTPAKAVVGTISGFACIQAAIYPTALSAARMNYLYKKRTGQAW